jgi:dihydrofolate synthase/folylpolyglutamate synthase
MDYSQAEQYLHRFIDYETIPGISFASVDYNLDHVEELLHRLGDPHLAARTVHIAGTKGKGSVAAMIAQVLTVSGYRTGLYTSPHLQNLRERIKINGGPILEKEFASLMTELKPFFEAMGRDAAWRRLTYYEALTVLAFDYFNKRQADFQVLEVGLGGRLDATNVAEPEVCIITPISLEHTQVLGDTLEKIAYEKAGIIKPGSLVVSSPQPEEAARVIGAVCRERQASLIRAGQDVTWHGVTSDLCQQSFTVEGKAGAYHITMPLLGDYQVENAAAAVAALELLASSGFRIAAGDIARGLARVDWPGRFQILRRQPAVLVDGAHNVASMRRLVENIKTYFDYDRIFLVIGTSCDKDIPGMVKELVPLWPQVLVTRSAHPRAASPSAVAAEFVNHGIGPEVVDDVAGALSQALSLAGKGDLICITGSLFVVAEALDYMSEA